MTKFLAASATQNDSIIILITGFVIVFAVLLLLIGIIKLYSTVVSAAFSAIERKKAKKAEADAEVAVETTQPSAPVLTNSDSIDSQTIAVIAAAVTAFYGADSKVRVHSVRRAKPQRSEWATAGINENIMARRGF